MKLSDQRIDSHEREQETLALLNILALGLRQAEKGRTQSASEVVRRIRERRTSDPEPDDR